MRTLGVAEQCASRIALITHRPEQCQALCQQTRRQYVVARCVCGTSQAHGRTRFPCDKPEIMADELAFFEGCSCLFKAALKERQITQTQQRHGNARAIPKLPEVGQALLQQSARTMVVAMGVE